MQHATREVYDTVEALQSEVNPLSTGTSFYIQCCVVCYGAVSYLSIKETLYDLLIENNCLNIDYIKYNLELIILRVIEDLFIIISGVISGLKE